jgi:glycosyltransferase involved in cell wall biosynthesis
MPTATVLTVVVPSFDAAAQLPTTLASADRNTTDGTEWLFVDDGSTDATARILAAFRPRAGTVRVLRNDAPTGVAAARERGLQEARGRYVAFLDADDWYAPGHLPRVTTAIERLGVDFVRTDHTQVRGAVRSVRRVPEGRRDRALTAHEGIGTRVGTLSAVDAPNIWAGVYRRELAAQGLLSADPAIRTAEDRLMIWRLHLHATSFAVVSEPGYFYRREVAGSLTTIGDERQLHFFDAYDAVEREIDGDPALERFRPKLVRSYVGIIAHHEEHRDRLHPAVHRRYVARARARLRSLPQELVTAAVRALPARRARIVERLR